MLLQYIMLFVIVTAGLVSFFIYVVSKRKRSEFVFPKAVLVIGIILIVVFGLILTPIFSSQLADAIEKLKWPHVEGTILTSHVVGGRAFRPDIQYEFVVDVETFHGSSFLNIPGFGGRMNRLDAAEKLVALYPAGKSITVYYNSENPAESTLTPNPTYSHYLKVGTSAFLFFIGMTLFFTFVFLSKKQPLYKERT